MTIPRRQFIAGGAAFVAALVLGGAKPPKPRPSHPPRPTPFPSARSAFAGTGIGRAVAHGASAIQRGAAFDGGAFSPAFQVE